MLEMYLFINPLGAKCYEAEQNTFELAISDQGYVCDECFR